MNIINFNTPFISELGEPVRRVRYDHTKTNLDADGNQVPTVAVDDDGNVIYETVTVKELVIQCLYAQTKDNASFDDKAFAGRIARKIASDSSYYYDIEIAAIKHAVGRIAAVALVAQVADLIEA